MFLCPWTRLSYVPLLHCKFQQFVDNEIRRPVTVSSQRQTCSGRGSGHTKFLRCVCVCVCVCHCQGMRVFSSTQHIHVRKRRKGDCVTPFQLFLRVPSLPQNPKPHPSPLPHLLLAPKSDSAPLIYVWHSNTLMSQRSEKLLKRHHFTVTDDYTSQSFSPFLSFFLSPSQTNLHVHRLIQAQT